MQVAFCFWSSIVSFSSFLFSSSSPRPSATIQTRLFFARLETSPPRTVPPGLVSCFFFIFLILRFPATPLRSARPVTRIHYPRNPYPGNIPARYHGRAIFRKSIATGWSKGSRITRPKRAHMSWLLTIYRIICAFDRSFVHVWVEADTAPARFLCPVERAIFSRSAFPLVETSRGQNAPVTANIHRGPNALVLEKFPFPSPRLRTRNVRVRVPGPKLDSTRVIHSLLRLKRHARRIYMYICIYFSFVAVRADVCDAGDSRPRVAHVFQRLDAR